MKAVSFRLTGEEREQVYQGLVDQASPNRSFYLLVFLSTSIAAFGLLANSTAVVIGAMLIAPLMGPIFGIALALCTGERRLLGRAGMAEALGVLLALALGFLIGRVPLRPEFGSEILGRTQPTIYDVLIAIISGLAGAYALTNRKISPAMPGVAIATALVPPLATSGLCLSAGEWQMAWGAFLLFFANFLAIEIAAALVFTLAGLAEVPQPGISLYAWMFQRFRLSLLLLVVVSGFMTESLVRIISNRRVTAAIERNLDQQVQAIAGAHLSEVRMLRGTTGLDVIAAVLTPQAFEPEQVLRMEETLRERVDGRIHLVVRSLISRDADRMGPVFITDSERRRREEAQAQTAFLTQATRTITGQLRGLPGAQLADLRRDPPSDGGAEEGLTALVRTPTAIGPADVTRIQEALRRETGLRIRLVIRSILTRDADADRYLYEPVKETPRLSERELRRRRRLQSALDNQLRLQIDGAYLAELQIEERGSRLFVLATARTPSQLQPRHVEAVQEALRKYVHPRIDLVVRSLLGTDTTARGHTRRLRPSGI